MSDFGVIAVHVGAGCHSSSLRVDYRKLMKKACREAVNALRNKGSSLDAVCCATRTLEDSPLTNAGYGSSLTMDGKVECDASVMDGLSCLHGAVGAVSGVKNPVMLAREILEAQKRTLPGGLIPPSLLSGPGAREWAISHDVPVCGVDALISDKARQIHKESVRYINQLKAADVKRRKVEASTEVVKSGLLDTVGAVCVGLDGSVAYAVSSGGILLKHSGRIGQAAVYGSGGWAQNNFEDSGVNIAVSTSGCGEHLIRTMFGKMCSTATLKTDPSGAPFAKDVKDKFIDSVFLKDVDSPMGGCLSIKFSPQIGVIDLFWLHTTRSMGVAYMASDAESPQAMFSELPTDRVGRTVALNCKSFSRGLRSLTEDTEPYGVTEEDCNSFQEETTSSPTLEYCNPSNNQDQDYS